MSLSANAYGSVARVEALTRKFTNSGSFSASTNPATAQVESWINSISATLNVLLAEQGFSIPVTQADCVEALELFVATAVADLVNYANSAGRFFNNQQYTQGPWSVISKEAADFIESHTNGFEALGAARTRDGLFGLDARTVNDAGDAIEPMFARDQFGNRNTDFDTADED